MIIFDNVTATYKSKLGIYSLSFKITKGEFVFLMGPTGAGKSTVLKSIYKDLEINSGSILIDGENISKITPRKIPKYRRKIGMVFQDEKLLYDRNVFENVSLPLKICGEKNKIINERASDILEKVSLSDKANAMPYNLSGGERQRVSIARALIKDPILILADEPTGNLDPVVADEVLDLLEMASSMGTSILMSTHNFPLIQPRKKRFIELDKGELITSS
tara:strand:- start:342 stop:998 length:657 start_codon:yes stop_codon:yes gene_type:complete